MRKDEHAGTAADYKVRHFKRSMRYLIVALLPLLLCWLLIINQSRDWAMRITEQNAANLVEKNASLIDKHLSGLRQDVYSLLNDQNFNELLIESAASALHYSEKSDELNTVVGQYFWNLESINSIYLVSSWYSDVFFYTTSLPRILKPENVAYREAITSSPTWFPAARIDEVISISDRYNKYFSDFQVITLGVKAPMSYVSKGVWHRSSQAADAPMLLLNLNTSIFDNWLKRDHLLDDTSYRIYTPDLRPVYTADALSWDELDPNLLPVPTGAEAPAPYSTYLEENGRGLFIYSRVLEETGWIITSYTSVDSAFLYFGSGISLVSLIVILLTILLVLVVVRVTMRGISEPLALLCEGLHETAEGNYAFRIHNTRYTSYQTVFLTYNSMNEHIDRLIKENYEVKLSEKELEIQMVNMQFNPHFLYNMLNIISLMALESGNEKVSDMLSKLSYMMRYSAKTASGIVPFHEDLHYIEAYISAMQLRANDNFEYVCDVAPELMYHPVPKFMLQPFVENAIQHGFCDASPDFIYTLRITGRREGDDLYFSVADNGKGFERQAIETLWKKENAGIGIANTHKRIQLYYGKRYGVTIESNPQGGAVVTVHIPYAGRQEAGKASGQGYQAARILS